jgi:hypothetical protein
MICSVIVVAAGLVLTLAGMIISFWANPPVVKLPTIAAKAEEQNAFIEALNRGEIRKPIKTKTEWSWLGVRLLVFGTGLQFIGTVWQIVRLACKG